MFNRVTTPATAGATTTLFEASTDTRLAAETEPLPQLVAASTDTSTSLGVARGSPSELNLGFSSVRMETVPQAASWRDSRPPDKLAEMGPLIKIDCAI